MYKMLRRKRHGHITDVLIVVFVSFAAEIGKHPFSDANKIKYSTIMLQINTYSKQFILNRINSL